MRARKSTIVFVLGILATATLEAGVIPGRWEKVESLPEADRGKPFC